LILTLLDGNHKPDPESNLADLIQEKSRRHDKTIDFWTWRGMGAEGKLMQYVEGRCIQDAQAELDADGTA
jgi:hypothetical protein